MVDVRPLSEATAFKRFTSDALALIEERAVPGKEGLPGKDGSPGAKGDPGAGGNVAVGRAQLKTGPAAAATPGDVWQLSEAARSGVFVATTGTAPIDVDDALSVSVDSGKYFVRAITRRVYEAAWALGSGTSFTDAQVPINRLLGLMEPGSDLVYPNARIEVSASIDSRVTGIRHVGAPGKTSRVVASSRSDLVNYWSGHPLMYLRCSDVGIVGMDYQHIHTPPSVQAGGGFCVEISQNDIDPAQTGGFQQKSILVRDVRCHDCSEGIVGYGNNRNGPAAGGSGYTTDPANYYPIDGYRLLDCDFITMGYQAFSIFMLDNVEIGGCRIAMRPQDRAGFTPDIRILGSRNVRLHNFSLYGSGLTGFGGDQRSFGVSILAATSRGTRRMNRDVHISDFIIENARYPFALVECEGTLMIADGIVKNDLVSTENTAFGFAADVPTDGVLSARGNNIDDLIIRNVRALGCANGPLVYGRYGSIDIEGLKLLSNARPADDSIRALLLMANDAYRYQQVRLANSEFLMPSGAGNVSVEINQGSGAISSAADYAEVVGNTFGAGPHINGTIYKTGAGSIRTAKGAALELAGSNGGASMGANDLAPAGLFQRMRTGAPG
jgi:hypothetical protein